MKALLVVDVQNDFCPGGSLAVKDGDKVVEPINKMIAFAKANGWLIFFSRDWHPEVTSHFAKDGGIWPVHCVQNTHGAEFHPNLKVSGFVISKGMRNGENAYSAFDGNCNGVSLLMLAKSYINYGVEEFYVAGLATDYCVKATALDAVKQGFKVKLLLDGCRAVDLKPGDGQAATNEMKAAGVVMTTTDEVING